MALARLRALAGLLCVMGTVSALSEARWAQSEAAAEKEGQTATVDRSAEPTAASQLTLGRVVSKGERKISIPLHFTAAEGVTVGEIQVEILLPDGPWLFRELKLPERAFWKVLASPRTQTRRLADDESRRVTVLELRFSAGSRAIRNGRIGSLVFSLASTEVPGPDSLHVEKIETRPPEPQLVEEPSEVLPPPTAEPPVNPSVGCFFFTH